MSLQLADVNCAVISSAAVLEGLIKSSIARIARVNAAAITVRVTGGCGFGASSLRRRVLQTTDTVSADAVVTTSSTGEAAGVTASVDGAIAGGQFVTILADEAAESDPTLSAELASTSASGQSTTVDTNSGNADDSGDEFPPGAFIAIGVVVAIAVAALAFWYYRSSKSSTSQAEVKPDSTTQSNGEFASNNPAAAIRPSQQ